ncbi:MAG: hypothetical protein K8R53_06145 [Bacteroidales bacterium]|nr:hypothetical protein [Bacteroidales bacterium]
MLKKVIRMVTGLDILFIMFSISFLGMGIIDSIKKGMYFYTAVCVVNIIAWWMALLVEEVEIKEIEKKNML